MFRKLLLLLFTGWGLSATLHAEGTPALTEHADSANYDLNPVVVTGLGAARRLKNSPTPVEVITAREIEAAGINGLQEALTMMVPSLSFSPTAMGSYLRLNGLDNAHVLVLLNGHRLIGDISGNVDLSQIDINRIKRIEVLGGAASTLYGSDAMGGVINVITQEGTDENSVNASGRYTSKNRFDQTVDMSLRAGRVGSFTAFNYSHSDGWQNNRHTMDGSEQIETLAQLSIGYTSVNLTQRFTYNLTDGLSVYGEGTYYNKLLDRPIERESIQGGSKYNNLYESFSWSAGGKWSLGTLGEVTVDYTGRTFGQWYKYIVSTGEYLPGELQLTKRQRCHDAEAKCMFNFSDNSNTVIGIGYLNQTLIRPDSDLDKSLYTLSAYAQHEQRLWHRLTGTAGVRYDNHQQTGSRLTPKVSLMYRAGDFNIRATYAMGYRTPGIDELYYHMLKPMGSRYTITFGNTALRAEESNYVSANVEYRTAHAGISVTGYMNFVHNMITSSSIKYTTLPAERQQALIEVFPEINDIKQSTLTVKEYYNFNKATVKGIQVNVSGNPCRGLQLSANYSLAFGRGLNDDGAWQRLNRSVRHTATVTANYYRTWGFYNLNINLNGRLQSRTYYPGDADGDATGYGVWNLTTRHRLNCFWGYAITPGLGIDNIFNRRDMATLNHNFALYSPGRSVVVSLSVNLQ